LQRIELAASKEEFDRYRLEAGEKIAEAEARANEAKLALAKLKAPRFLTPNGQRNLAQEMIPCNGLRVILGTSPPSTDAASFASALKEYLKLQDWTLC
jgi:hypothetical protein